MRSAVFDPNFAADSSRTSLSVSTWTVIADEASKPATFDASAGERLQRLVRALADGRGMREQDRLDVQLREARYRAACRRHVVGEEGVRIRHGAAHALEEVPDDQETPVRRVETDAARRVSRRVDDPEPAERRQHVAVA